jgi:hypothetical protein
VRKGELSTAALAAAFGIVIFIAVRPTSPVLVRVGIPIGCLALAVFLVLRAITGGDRLTRDLRRPRVDSIEGPISKHSTSTTSSGSSASTYYLIVAGQPFEVGSHAYQAAPDAGFVRLYFLSISRHVVNLEQLPARSLPEGTTPQAVFQEYRQAMRSHDRAKLDEVRAEMAGTVNALQGGLSHDVAPPPDDRRDQRPLQDAIVGTWNNGPVTVVFGPEGTFSITLLRANQRSGRWSVDGNGQLVANLGGRGQATDAWIVGDQLTVSLGGSAFTLNRAS